MLGGSLSFGLDDDNAGGDDLSSDSLSAFFATGGEPASMLPMTATARTTYLGCNSIRVATTPLIFDSNCLPLPESELIQSPSEARGLGNENGRSRRNRVVGGLGGFPPHYRAYLAPPASRGGVWGGSSPPF